MTTRSPDPDKREFVELLRVHQRIAQKVSSIYAVGIADRDDLFQEIVMQLWRAWPSFRGEASFATWAFRVALNTALFRKRRAARGRAPLGQEMLGTVPAPSVQDPLEAREAAELLHECIRSLPEFDRAIVLMHLEARPHSEIAEFTGLTTGNVDVRLHRSKKTLRECLRRRGYVEE